VAHSDVRHVASQGWEASDRCPYIFYIGILVSSWFVIASPAIPADVLSTRSCISCTTSGHLSLSSLYCFGMLSVVGNPFGCMFGILYSVHRHDLRIDVINAAQRTATNHVQRDAIEDEFLVFDHGYFSFFSTLAVFRSRRARVWFSRTLGILSWE